MSFLFPRNYPRSKLRGIEPKVIKPDAAQVADQLRDGEDRDCVAHSKDQHQERQQHRRAAESRHRRERGRQKSAASEQEQIRGRREQVHTTAVDQDLTAAFYDQYRAVRVVYDLVHCRSKKSPSQCGVEIRPQNNEVGFQILCYS